MTHNIRKNAPDGATHYEIVDNEVWYYRLNDDNTISHEIGGVLGKGRLYVFVLS